MSFDQDQSASENMNTTIGRRQAPRNGRDIPVVADAVFAQQVVAMDVLTKRLYGYTHRLEQALDVALGMADAPSPGSVSNTIEGTPSNVPDAWKQLCQAVDALEHQISRAYRG